MGKLRLGMGMGREGHLCRIYVCVMENTSRAYRLVARCEARMIITNGTAQHLRKFLKHNIINPTTKLYTS